MPVNQTQLVEMASNIARQQGAPVTTIVKELLHYEILFALNQSGVANSLVFQGGTALRLCYGGLRYSEDLDFVSGSSIPELPMKTFTELLIQQIGESYGLHVDVKAPGNKDGNKERGVIVERWKATVQVPNPNPAITQSQFINIEIAAVPAYERDYLPIVQNYPELPQHLKQMLIAVETLKEIMADKMVALGAREYVKARDIWDIKFLHDKGVKVDVELVLKKVGDYGHKKDKFLAGLATRIKSLDEIEVRKKFESEMVRFVDARTAKHFKNKDFVDNYMECSKRVGEMLINT